MFNLGINEWRDVAFNIVLLSFLVSGLFIRTTTNRGHKIRILSIWIFVIFIIAILYNNRNILFRNFIPYIAYDNGNNELKVKKSNDNHFYISLDINNKNILFLVDTGATTTTLNLQDAKRIGINIEELIYNIPVNTANGISYSANVEVKNIKVGNFYINSMWVLVNKTLDGNSLLGMNFLNKLNGYSIKQDEMTLYY